MGVDWIIVEYDKLLKLVEAQTATVSQAVDNIIGDDFEFAEETAAAAATESTDKCQ